MIPMTAVPPYSEQGDFVFPDQNSSQDSNAGDPFAAEKTTVTPYQPAQDIPYQPAQDSAVAAAEKVRQDQLAAYEQHQKSRPSTDDSKHGVAGSPGYGGISRLTVT